MCRQSFCPSCQAEKSSAVLVWAAGHPGPYCRVPGLRDLTAVTGAWAAKLPVIAGWVDGTFRRDRMDFFRCRIPGCLVRGAGRVEPTWPCDNSTKIRRPVSRDTRATRSQDSRLDVADSMTGHRIGMVITADRSRATVSESAPVLLEVINRRGRLASGPLQMDHRNRDAFGAGGLQDVPVTVDIDPSPARSVCRACLPAFCQVVDRTPGSKSPSSDGLNKKTTTPKRARRQRGQSAKPSGSHRATRNRP